MTGWKALNTGFSDFNGDTNDDILFQNTSNGQLVTWNMANNDIIPNGINTLGGPVTSDWKYKGTGDFTDDGHEDILWQQDGTGAVRVWDVLNNTVERNSLVATVSSDWQIRGVGDFQSDGAEDVLWQNTNSGQLGYWDFNPVAAGAAPSYSFVQIKDAGGNWVGVDSIWQVADVGDYNGGVNMDIFWHNTISGQNAVWTIESGGGFDNFTFQLAPTTSLDWQILG